MTDSASTPSKAQAWQLAARPKTLPAAVAPVLVGVGLAFADGVFRVFPALAALVGALLLQVAVNFANDLFDHQRGIDTPDRLGPPRAAALGLLTETEMGRGLALVLLVAVGVGVYLVTVGGWPILVVGVVSILAALAYSGGPFPLASNGLGDLFVFVFFGLVAVGGTYWVQALTLPTHVLLAAVPPGLLITAILVVNNLRDIPTDSQTGKRTLAVILGPRGARIEYTALLIVSYLMLPLFVLMGWIGYAGLLPFLTLPLAVVATRRVLSDTGRALNPSLGRTANLALYFSVLLALGAALGI